jgi:EAL domain-containing protein (putative c-di-GMP-specific phosphodiesterase class I)
MSAAPPDDSITLHYQPLADIRGRVVGFEALMRWHHQKRGPISPEAFIPIFENSGLILPLSRWALKQACLDAVSWKRPMQVSVNLSPVQFEHDDVPAMVASILTETGLAPERLELEISEASITADPDRTGAALRALAAQGVRLAFDDATGDVALPFMLKDYPFSKVKIARSLVDSIDTSPSARSLIHMILVVGHSLNIPVAAKGIETAGQLAFILKQGCDFMQGFFVSRPAAMSAFAGMTGNASSDFVPGSTRLADGMRLIVPLHADAAPPAHVR